MTYIALIVKQIYATEDGQAHPLWTQFGYQPFDLVYESADHVDWSM